MPRTKKETVEEGKDKAVEKIPVKKTGNKSGSSAKNPRKIFENINKVDGLNTSALLKPYVNPITREATEDAFMPVKDRVSWFRLVYPKGRIVPTLVAETKTFVRAKAEIYFDDNPESVPIAVGSAVIEFDNPIYGGINAYNSAETCAVGRALSFAGFGTQASGEELESPVIDAGVPANELTGNALDAVEDSAEELKAPESVSDTNDTIKEEVVEIEDNVNAVDEEVIAYNKKVKMLLETEMNGTLAGGCIIPFGDLKNKTVKEAFIELQEKGKDPIEALSKCLLPDELKSEYAVVSAACAYYIDAYNKKQGNKNKEGK